MATLSEARRNALDHVEYQYREGELTQEQTMA